MDPLQPLLVLIALVFIPGWVIAAALVMRFGPRTRSAVYAGPIRRGRSAASWGVVAIGAAFLLSGLWIAALVDAPGTGVGGTIIALGGVAMGLFAQAGRRFGGSAAAG